MDSSSRSERDRPASLPARSHRTDCCYARGATAAHPLGPQDLQSRAFAFRSKVDLVAQQVHFCTAGDGVGLAYAVHGSGPPIVRAATWLTHLDFDWESPVWRHWLAELSDDHTLVRYDERGCGLSDRELGELSVETWVGDLETVVDAAGVDSFTLLGVSQGAASRSSMPCGIPSGSVASSSTGLRARPDAARRGGARACGGDRVGDPRGLDGREPDLPPSLQHAVPPAGDRAADGVVRRAAAALDLG